jgi:hypothetical protein
MPRHAGTHSPSASGVVAVAGEAKEEEEEEGKKGVWQAGVEVDHVHVEEDPEHHDPQRPHRHLWYVHLVWSQLSPCMLIYISFD